MKRRDFLKNGAGAIVATGIGLSALSQNVAAEKSVGSDPLKQPPLPYGLGDLAPFLTEEQMSFHYGKHHAGYFKKLNDLIGNKLGLLPTLEELIQKSDGVLFNNAAQAWNHTFFWNCMSPKGGGQPGGALAKAIEKDFGGFTKFQDQFKAAAAGLFGSGWVWLAKDGEKLEIVSASNADTPLKTGKKPVLVLDVWEHAYYVDYRNDRAKFIAGFMDKINWPFAEEQLIS